MGFTLSRARDATLKCDLQRAWREVSHSPIRCRRTNLVKISLGRANCDNTNNSQPLEQATVASTPECLGNAMVVDAVAIGAARIQAPQRLRQGCAAVGSAVEWLFGLACLMVLLAITATLPVIQFISLGYLLESAGRVARSGRLRDGLFLVRQSARVGSLIVGTWLMLLPLRVIADYWYSSWLIDAASPETRVWRVALTVATVVMLGHVFVCWIYGGRFRHFFWPLLAVVALPWWVLRVALSGIFGRPRPLADWLPPAVVWADLRRGGWYVRWRDAVWEFTASLGIPSLFWLGLRGAVGTVAWLLVPVALLVLSTRMPAGAGVLTGLAGGLMLALALLYLPFLQTRFAVQNRWRAMFQVGEVRPLFRRAPVAFAVALAVTLLFALPLYLLKIEMTPREVAHLPSLVFVVFILPARLMTGWALSRAERCPQARWFVWRWAARLIELPVVVFYVVFVFLTGYTSWYGVWSLFEQHALLIPVPFIGL